jgi:hypothetical protein
LASKEICASISDHASSISAPDLSFSQVARFKNVESLVFAADNALFTANDGCLSQMLKLKHLTVNFEKTNLNKRFGDNLRRLDLIQWPPNLESLRYRPFELLRQLKGLELLPRGLKVLFISADMESLAVGLSDLDVLPHLAILGAECPMQIDSTGFAISRLLELRPELRILDSFGGTLWMRCMHSIGACMNLKELKDQFPGQLSFDINAVDYENGKTALQRAIGGIGHLSTRTVKNLIMHDIDPDIKFSAKIDPTFSGVLDATRQFSPFVYALYKKAYEPAKMLWPSHRFKCADFTSEQWIAQEPVHPLVAAFQQASKGMVMRLMHRWPIHWDMFAPMRPTAPAEPTLESSIPLVIACLSVSTFECAQFYLNELSIDPTSQAQLVSAVNAPMPTGQGHVWLHHLVRHANYEVIKKIALLPGVDMTVRDGDGYSVSNHFLLHKKGNFRKWLNISPEDYVAALEKDGSERTPLNQVLVDILNVGSPKVHKFLLSLQKHLLSGECKYSLVTFLGKWHALMDPKNFTALLSCLPDDFGSMNHRLFVFPCLLSSDDTEMLARKILSSVTDDRVSESIQMLQTLYGNGCHWMNSQAFFDIVWENWSFQNMMRGRGIFSVSDVFMLPSKRSVSMFEVASLAPINFRHAAALKLWQQQIDGKAEDKSWMISLPILFPVSSGKGEPDSFPRSAEAHSLLFSMLQTLTFQSFDLIQRYLVLAVSRGVPLALLRSLLEVWSVPSKEALSCSMWEAVFQLDHVEAIDYALQVAELLAEMGLAESKACLKLHIERSTSPKIVSLYMKLHGFPYVRRKSSISVLSDQNNFPAQTAFKPSF